MSIARNCQEFVLYYILALGDLVTTKRLHSGCCRKLLSLMPLRSFENDTGLATAAIMICISTTMEDLSDFILKTVLTYVSV